MTTRSLAPYLQRFFTERLGTRDQDHAIEPSGALIHHWVGTIFIPGASLDQVLAVVQDYDRHQQYYAPQVLKSKLIGRSGDEFRVYLRLKQTDVITVVFDTAPRRSAGGVR